MNPEEHLTEAEIRNLFARRAIIQRGLDHINGKLNRAFQRWQREQGLFGLRFESFERAMSRKEAA